MLRTPLRRPRLSRVTFQSSESLLGSSHNSRDLSRASLFECPRVSRSTFRYPRLFSGHLRTKPDTSLSDLLTVSRDVSQMPETSLGPLISSLLRPAYNARYLSLGPPHRLPGHVANARDASRTSHLKPPSCCPRLSTIYFYPIYTILIAFRAPKTPIFSLLYTFSNQRRHSRFRRRTHRIRPANTDRRP